MRELYSIRDAARAAGLPEERLRRAILTGALVAQPVADDRQYLIRASELRHFAGLPEPEPAADLPCCGRPSFLRMAVALTFIVGAVLLILQLSPRSVPAVCLDCGSVKEVFGSRRFLTTSTV